MGIRTKEAFSSLVTNPRHNLFTRPIVPLVSSLPITPFSRRFMDTAIATDGDAITIHKLNKLVLTLMAF